MTRKPLVFGIALLLMVITVPQSVSAIGVLKIEVPSRIVAGEEVEIKVIDSLTGDPVEGADVYINGLKVGTTDDDGIVYYVFDTPGVYVIGATKFGYTPALEVSVIVEAPEETPTPTPVETPKTEVYRGLVFDQDLLLNLFGADPSIVDKSEMPDLIEKALDEKPITPLAFFTDGNHYMVLYGDVNLRNSYYEIEGYDLGATFEFEGITWKLFEVTSARELQAERVDVNDLVSNPSNYIGKEIIVSAPFREVSFKLESFGKPICIGSISTLPVDFREFTEKLKEFGEELIKEPDRETIEEITKFAGISTFRFENSVGVGLSTQAYWKAVDAEITALVIPANLVKVVFPDELRELISERGIVLLIESVNIPAERVSLKDLVENPGAYSGKVVEIPSVYSIATDVSIKNTIATVFPPAAASPVDAYFEPMAVFNIPPDAVLLGFGVTGFSQNYGSVDENVRIEARYTLKGVVLTANIIDENLPSIPALIVFERHRENYEDRTVPSDQAKEIIETFNLIRNTIVGVKYEKEHKEEKKPEKTPKKLETPEEIETPEIEETPRVEVTPKETPTPEERALQSLTVDISPSSVTANPGDTIKLKLKVDWEPKDWRGEADVKIILSAAGFKKEFELPDVILENPPIEEEFSYTLPDNLPPLTYEAKIVVEAGGIKAEDSVEIKVGTSKTPGFELVAGLIGLAGAVALRRWSG